jgi:hypothetical protein
MSVFINGVLCIPSMATGREVRLSCEHIFHALAIEIEAISRKLKPMLFCQCVPEGRSRIGM